MQQTSHYLAVDGGGTKTDIVWFDGTGQVHGRVIGSASNPNDAPLEKIKAEFAGLLKQLFQENNKVVHISSVFAGVAGGGHPDTRRKIQEILSCLLPDVARITVDNDAVNALWSGTGGSPGMVLIAGTGSIVYGQLPDGSAFRVGGWGYLLGDEGSGFDLGRKALKAIMRAFDGRGQHTLLTPMILEHFAKDSPFDLIPLVYGQGKPLVASVSPLVIEAVRQGDKLATDILESSMRGLAELVAAGIQKLNLGQEPAKVVLAGGMWQAGDLLLPLLQRSLAKYSIEWIQPELPPVYGAALYAVKQAEQTVADGFKVRFADSLPG